MQALLKRPNRANTIIVKLDDPQQAQHVAAEIERRFGYKSVSWQEASEDMMSTLVTRNIIMYTVVSAVLIVAAFGIYNVISTVVLEKQRDIAILKSIGFRARDIRRIFLIQGLLLGIAGQRRRAAARRGADVGPDAGPAEISRRHRSGAVADRLELAAIRDRRGFRDRGCGRSPGCSRPARAPRVQPVDILRGAQ